MDPTITGTAKSGTENFEPLRQTVVTFQWPIVCSTLYMDFNILSILDTDSAVGAEIFFYSGIMLGTGPRATTFVGLI